jgi:hypothetical protein
MHHLYALTMRTTVRLDDQLLRAAKRYAHETGLTLTAVIEMHCVKPCPRVPHRYEDRARGCPRSKATACGGESIWMTLPPYLPRWMRHVILPDVNVLVYAHLQDAANHHAYLHWLEGLINSDHATVFQIQC